MKRHIEEVRKERAAHIIPPQLQATSMERDTFYLRKGERIKSRP
jgi:hypothetical protein